MKKAFVITVSILSAVIIVLGAFLISTSNNLTATSMSLESMYQRSLYDLVDNVNNLEVEVSKLMVTNDSTSQQKILSSVKQKTSDAEEALSLLPVNNYLLEKTTKFMNQLNGYCTSLISYKDGKLETTDLENINNIHASITTIKEELNKVMEKVMHGYKISENIGNEGEKLSGFSSALSNLSNDTVEYPSLIYDGPFSDSTSQKAIKGIGENEVSENEAESIITKLFQNKITNLSYLGDTKGKFETYDFGVNTSDGRNYFIQITKKGGFLLTMSSNLLEKTENGGEGSQDSETASQNDLTIENVDEKGTKEKAEAEGVKIDEEGAQSRQTKNAQTVAIEFAKKLGLEDMECVWSASSQDVCYVNLAPVIDDIIMYPDLIKVKIDLNEDSIIGWEASSYAYNHTQREDLIAQLSEEDAKALVSKNLNIDTQKLCVIPLDYVGETLAYEFAGKYNNFNYYLYIDAYTGNQVRVLRVIQTNEGELVL